MREGSNNNTFLDHTVMNVCVSKTRLDIGLLLEKQKQNKQLYLKPNIKINSLSEGYFLGSVSTTLGCR
jgi:hypothetical protein